DPASARKTMASTSRAEGFCTMLSSPCIRRRATRLARIALVAVLGAGAFSCAEVGPATRAPAASTARVAPPPNPTSAWGQPADEQPGAQGATSAGAGGSAVAPSGTASQQAP